jgi:hypothetical protein
MSEQYVMLTTISQVVQFYVVKDKVWDHAISLEYISTKKMLTDPLTKGLLPNMFREQLAGMGLQESI